MFADCEKALSEWLETKGRANARQREIAAIVSVMTDYPGPGVPWDRSPMGTLTARIGLNDLLEDMKPPRYVPYSRSAANIEGRNFWESTYAGHMLSSVFWVLYAGSLMSPISAAEVLFPEKRQSSRTASGSVAYYAKQGWLTAIFRPALFMGVRLDNPDGQPFTGSWVVLESEVRSRAALQMTV